MRDQTADVKPADVQELDSYILHANDVPPAASAGGTFGRKSKACVAAMPDGFVAVKRVLGAVADTGSETGNLKFPGAESRASKFVYGCPR